MTLSVRLLLPFFVLITACTAPGDPAAPVEPHSTAASGSVAESTASVPYGANEANGQFVELNGIRIYFEVYGEGAPLLVLHGNGGSIAGMRAQIPAFAENHRVIAVDSRGQGQSSDGDAEITYALMAEDMVALLNALELDKADVFGWSDGGIIGISMAHAHPERVGKVVAFGANYHWDDAIEFPTPAEDDTPDPLLKVIEPYAAQFIEDMKNMAPETQVKLGALMEQYPNFTLEALSQIQCPILVMSGDHDLVKLEHTLRMFQHLPHAQLSIIPGSSHCAPWEQPEVVNATSLRFFDSEYRDFNPAYWMSIFE